MSKAVVPHVIEIKTTKDVNECDTCGTDWAEGGAIFIDNKIAGGVVPLASCFGGVHANTEELLILALAHLGIDVIIDGDQAHISNTEVSEQRNDTLKEFSG